MADFERLDPDEAARFLRWRRMEDLMFAARVVLAQSSLRAALAQRLEAGLDPANPATPADRTHLLGVRADAIRLGRRAAVAGNLARVRLSGLLASRRAE